MTVFLFLGAGYVGYAYARLRHDEALKRHMTTRYANFMWLFNVFADWYDATYDRTISLFMALDSSYSFWKQRRTLIADFWAQRAL